MSREIEGGKIHKKFLMEIVEAMSFLLRNGSIISVKRIRNHHKYQPEDRSRINFYWRWLKVLRDDGFLEEIKNTQPKRYKVKKLLEECDIERLIIKRIEDK